MNPMAATAAAALTTWAAPIVSTPPANLLRRRKGADHLSTFIQSIYVCSCVWNCWFSFAFCWFCFTSFVFCFVFAPLLPQTIYLCPFFLLRAQPSFVFWNVPGLSCAIGFVLRLVDWISVWWCLQVITSCWCHLTVWSEFIQIVKYIWYKHKKIVLFHNTL